MNTTIDTLNRALQAIIDADLDGSASTGYPRYRRNDIESVEAGMVPQEVEWTADRGNWMWDGVLVTLRALGVDPGAPL
jgi:hypothetical protein